MESTFFEVREIKVTTVENRVRAGATWVKINVYDKEGEHVIYCFPKTGQTIPIALHPMGDDDD